MTLTGDTTVLSMWKITRLNKTTRHWTIQICFDKVQQLTVIKNSDPGHKNVFRSRVSPTKVQTPRKVRASVQVSFVSSAVLLPRKGALKACRSRVWKYLHARQVEPWISLRTAPSLITIMNTLSSPCICASSNLCTHCCFHSKFLSVTAK
jgi:hypothetical protein